MHFFVKSTIERKALDLIIPILYKDQIITDTKYTDPSGYDSYEAIITTKHDYMTYTDIIEVKVRDTHYQQLLFEKDKYDFLVEETLRELHRKIYYINVTPEGTWVFNLKELIDIPWCIQELVKSTCDKGRGKKRKAVSFLNIDDGIKIDVRKDDLNLVD